MDKLAELEEEKTHQIQQEYSLDIESLLYASLPNLKEEKKVDKPIADYIATVFGLYASNKDIATLVKYFEKSECKLLEMLKNGHAKTEEKDNANQIYASFERKLMDFMEDEGYVEEYAKKIPNSHYQHIMGNLNQFINIIEKKEEKGDYIPSSIKKKYEDACHIREAYKDICRTNPWFGIAEQENENGIAGLIQGEEEKRTKILTNSMKYVRFISALAKRKNMGRKSIAYKITA